MRRVGTLTPLNLTALAIGLAFLYGPILLVVLFSFNASRLVTVWAGFSLDAYRALPANAALLSALWTSLVVALASAAIATILGTLAALALVRAGRFLGRGLFTTLVYVPLVLPEVVTGLALLLLFVGLDLERGWATVAIAHITLTMSFVTLVVQARLVGFDWTLEDAARDLGASPLCAFLTVTVPVIAPAIVAGFLLAFTLSLDDLVLASFASGPGSTTLPMYVFGQARRGVTPEINAVSTLLIAAVAIMLAAATLFAKARAGRV
jgi:putrescine transport system permease protein